MVTDWLRRWLGPTGAASAEEDQLTLIGAETYQSRFISIADRNFFGRYSTSPDGSYVLAWRDANDEQTVGGSRDRGEGQCLLVRSGTVVASSRAQRPNDGKVADNGRYIVNDWLFGGDLSGRLLAFDAEGRTIVDQYFGANLINNGLSSDGRYAVCQTASSPGSDDGELLALFDLDEGRLIARWHPEPGQAETYDFDGEQRELIAHYRDGEVVRYRFDGEMIDRDAWLERRIARGDVFVISRIVHRDDDAWRTNAGPLLAGLDVAAKSDEYFGIRPRAMRLKGELLDQLGREDEALEAYDAALVLDPQIGVARRAGQLRKKLRPEEAKATARMSRFERQASKLGIEHEIVPLEAGILKEWRCSADDRWDCVEEAALRHYEREGWTGLAAEGGLILTLLKAASFDPLPVRNADTFVEALYAQNVVYEEDLVDAARLIENAGNASLGRIELNWELISATAGDTPAFYPKVQWTHVKSLFEALGTERLAEIARVFATAPYDYRAGWPDLTLWRGTDVRFVEVKSPSDQLHASQSRLMSGLLVPLGFRTGLAEVRRQEANGG